MKLIKRRRKGRRKKVVEVDEMHLERRLARGTWGEFRGGGGVKKERVSIYNTGELRWGKVRKTETGRPDWGKWTRKKRTRSRKKKQRIPLY